jgi:hypothetical protein
MAREKLSEESRLRIQVTRLKKGIKSRDEKIALLEARIVTLEKELIDIRYQFEQMKEIVFGKKWKAKKILDEDEKKKPPFPRTKESYTRAIPSDDEITTTVHHKLPEGNFTQTRIKTFYVEDIPLDIHKIVEKHLVVQGYRDRTWIGEIKLPCTTVALGENVRMFITTLVTEQRLSYSQVTNLLALVFHIQISEGEIAVILSKEAKLLTTTYDALLTQVQNAPYHHIDETGWKVKGDTGHAWSMTDNLGSSVYMLGVSRGKGIAEKLRGNSQAVLISDDYGVYKNLTKHHQLCFAHLIRHFRDLVQSSEFKDGAHQLLVKNYTEVKEIYHEIKDSLTQENRESKRDYFTKKFTTISSIDSKDPPPLKRIKTTLAKNIQKYLTCLSFPSLPLTNNPAEQSLRHLVIKRRISFGSTSYKGAQVLSVLFTVVRELLRRSPDTYFQAYRELRRV